MADRHDCIDELLKSLKDRRDRKFVRENLEELDARAEADTGARSYQEALMRAARDMLQEELERSANRRREMQLQALAMRDVRTFLKSAKDSGLSYRKGIEALLHGTNEQFFDPKSRRGNRTSAEANGLGAQREWIADGVLGDLERIARNDPNFPGLDRQFFSRTLEDQIFIEKAELEAGAKGNPGRTKNPAAQKIAEVLVKWDKVEMAALNGEGAWITPRQRHIAELNHDPNKLRRAAKPLRATEPQNWIYRGFTEADRAAWVAKTLQWIDAKAMFGSQAADAEKLLAKMYGGIINGHEMAIALNEPVMPNVAGAVSTPRAFVFKTPEAQLAYMKEFGRFNPTEQWLHTKRTAANRFGLMKSLGPKPKETFEEAIAWAKNDPQISDREKSELRAWAPDEGGGRLRARYAVVSGEADRPIANMMTGLVVADMAVQRLSKLGSAILAMIQDNATISRELARQGLAFAERNASILSGYVDVYGQGTAREAARLLATGRLGRLRGGAARFDIMDAQAGTLARLENTFFKISGMTAVTENKRGKAEELMALHFGGKRGKAWADIGDPEQRTMQAFGIGDREWALLNTVEWTKIGDETYLSPDIATRLSDADVAAYLKGRGTIRDQAMMASENAAAAATSAVERERQALALNLWAYYADRGMHAVIEVGARERAILYRGTQSGDALNLALRMLLQFKQFPTAMITRAWGAEIYGGGRRMDKLAGLTELIVASTMFGILTNMLSDTAKGQDPMARWRNHPVGAFGSGFLRGGVASIYGDFLLGEFNRFGMPASSTLIGPTFGQVDQLAELWSDITHPTGNSGVAEKPKAVGSLALKLARNNTPFANMVYTRWIADYMFLYRMQEWMNPGYLERMERTMKEKQGVEFWLRPTQVSR